MNVLAQLDWIAIVSRWAHILAAITAVGGTIFMRAALVPSVRVLADDDRKKLHEQVRSRWAKFVMASILFLLVSGIYNYAQKNAQGVLPIYQMLWGIKVLIAVAIFFLASALTGRNAAFAKIRANARFWLTLNMTLAIIVVCISGVLRALPPKSASTPAPVQAANAP